VTTTTETDKINDFVWFKTKGALKRIAEHDGILFITVIPTGGPQMRAGDELEFGAFTDACIALLGKAEGLDTLKVQIGDNAVQVVKTSRSTVAVVFVLGHPVVKSLGRMMRRLDRSTAPEAPPRKPVDESATI